MTAMQAVLTLALAGLGAFSSPAPAPATGGPGADSVTVSGTVLYADGRPVAGCQVVVLHPGFDPLVETRCDAEGRYQLRLEPGRYNAIAILDDGYAKSTLEFWAWNVDARQDLDLSATIDRLEVYDLAVWNSKGGTRSFFVSFRPMALDRVLAGLEPRPGEVAGEEALVLDVAPALDAEHITVSVDGREAAIEMVQWYYHRVPAGDGPESHLPVCLVQVERPALESGLHELRVLIRDRETGASGEAVTWFTSNEAGLGF